MSTVGEFLIGEEMFLNLFEISKRNYVSIHIKSIIVGCGSLGKALLNYKKREGNGLDIVADSMLTTI